MLSDRFGDLVRTGDRRTVSQNAGRVHSAEVAANAGWRSGSIGAKNCQVTVLVDHGSREAGVVQPGELCGHGVGQINAVFEGYRHGHGRGGNHHVAEHESTTRAQRGENPLEEIGLPVTRQMVYRECRDDEVERARRKGIFQASPEERGSGNRSSGVASMSGLMSTPVSSARGWRARRHVAVRPVPEPRSKIVLASRSAVASAVRS